MADLDTAIQLVSLADVKEFLQIGSAVTSENSWLQAFINAASKMINDYTGRHILQKTWTEYHDMTCFSRELIVSQYPIISVTSVHDDPIDRTFGDGSLIATTDYYVEKQSGIIRLNQNVMGFLPGFQSGNAGVKVVYVAGYASASIPQSIDQAVKRLVA